MLLPETTGNLRPGEAVPANTLPANTQCEPNAQLSALCIAHDDLDAVIAALLEAGLGDDLLLGRLKKRKLRLKDQIAALRMQHEPAAESQAS